MKAHAREHESPERAFLIGAQFRVAGSVPVRESLDELAELATTAGAEVIGDGIQKLTRPCAATFIGPGKAAEFAQRSREGGADTVIFDDELSPAQARNLEKVFDRKVLDRTALILDIFSQRARSREGKLQIELAQLQHLLPRLTRFWSHLSRQKGGIGMRGDGETQLEVDRRRVLERIGRLRTELDQARRHRATQRTGRKRGHWPLVSIVGYTNAGKSTLFNALTGAHSLAEDRLFATLDPTTRRLRMPSNQKVLLSDTVGFIRKLPHQLVESFKATLEEVAEADLLLHVVDAANGRSAEQIAAVEVVLSEIGAQGKPTLMVFNKIDRLEDPRALGAELGRHPAAVAVSARSGEGLEALMAELGALLRPIRSFMDLQIPQSEGRVLARLRSVGQVIEETYDGQNVMLKARVPSHCRSQFERYALDERDA